ncbi:MAG: hypothetical protein QME07_02540 [bacterium]|nr:hypothetical protein [bacterium]
MKKLIGQPFLLLTTYYLLLTTSYAATVKVDPSTITCTSLKPFTVDIVAEGFSDLYGAAFHLVFDPDYVSVVSCREGGLLKSDGKPTFAYAEKH